MPDCDYCEESFPSEDAYLEHLESAHEGELGPIDRRRLGKEDDSGFNTRPLLLGAVIIIPTAVLLYVLFFPGGAGNPIPEPDRTPTSLGAVHENGTINVTIGGDQLDFSRDRFQNPGEYRAFHFERGDGEVWHVHARQVTLKYAMYTLAIGVTEDSVTFEGRTYVDGENATVIVEVNGEPVDPDQYVLEGASVANAQDGDHVRIVVREAE